MVEWLSHPQASFYLVLVPSVLLLALGMMMVLSASSVFAYVRFDDAYYFVKRQVVFVVIGGVATSWLGTVRRRAQGPRLGRDRGRPSSCSC